MIDHLPCLHVNPTTITVSGNSLGGGFAEDMSIIYSSEIVGAGFIGAASFNNEKNNKKKFITGKTSLQMAEQSDQMVQERFI